MNKIRKGDEVVVLAGKDRGRRGAVLRRVDDERVVVEGVNRVKKHVRPNPLKGEVGGIVEKEMPIHVSNVALFNPAAQKADRVGIKVLEDGRKVRFFKSNGELVDA
ncbi:50S ribosomal protein L24 [Azoarcus olearius]|uniref:Large ribosomal subunit protein uL24 n=2 Tax=Azoarcus sp. (strain BH72) TaxID=418699 RepID=RL24_AZOSB|nr:50S ribosomal protein L24 [Azoarcus olearius]A1KB16.1 RecName: Full=Large ribosomal subunit protein uL24; AltName: Full=50S ribosomal protein L24 [Azoarcus olearius]ANQ86566.1 50S ribosomal protein L24 [Azoarcus olearius]CAL96022.1 50S ribosomal protein L24 [Azoarcus olearius]